MKRSSRSKPCMVFQNGNGKGSEKVRPKDNTEARVDSRSTQTM